MNRGHIGCRDSSKNQPARHHFEANDDTLIRGAEPGKNWKYGYAHDRHTNPA